MPGRAIRSQIEQIKIVKYLLKMFKEPSETKFKEVKKGMMNVSYQI